MHVYIYDALTGRKKYAAAMVKIETRLTDLGLNGKIIRLGAMKNMAEAVERELKQGAKTVIAVGDNGTLNRILNAVLSVDQNSLPYGPVPLGFIPVGNKGQSIAAALGIGIEEEAGAVLSARRIEILDVGLANNTHFIAGAHIDNEGTTVEIDHNYVLEIKEPGAVDIFNLPPPRRPAGLKDACHPQDGELDLCLTSPGKRGLPFLSARAAGASSRLPFTSVLIKNQAKKIVLDNAVEIEPPAEIRLAARKIPVIVGRQRHF